MSAPAVSGLLFIFSAAAGRLARASQTPAWAIDSSNPDLKCNEWFYGVYDNVTTAFIVPCTRSTGTNYTSACSDLERVEINLPYLSSSYRQANGSAPVPFCPKSPEMQYDVISYRFLLKIRRLRICEKCMGLGQ